MDTLKYNYRALLADLSWYGYMPKLHHRVLQFDEDVFYVQQSFIKKRLFFKWQKWVTVYTARTHEEANRYRLLFSDKLNEEFSRKFKFGDGVVIR